MQKLKKNVTAPSPFWEWFNCKLLSFHLPLNSHIWSFFTFSLFPSSPASTFLKPIQICSILAFSPSITTFLLFGLFTPVVHCPSLSPPQNGFFIQNVCNNHYDAACGVKCQPGFDLHGTGIRLCQADGTWSGSPASCRGECQLDLRLKRVARSRIDWTASVRSRNTLRIRHPSVHAFSDLLYPHRGRGAVDNFSKFIFHHMWDLTFLSNKTSKN